MFTLGQYEKNGRQYYNVIKQQLTTSPRAIDFEFENLFDGDQESAGRFNKILKENVLEVYEDVKSGYDEAFGRMFAFVFDRFLTRVPVVYLFGEQ